MGDAYLAAVKVPVLDDEFPSVPWQTALCRRAKHYVLDHAHPLPASVRVFAGPPGSLERCIVRGVLGVVDVPGLVECGAAAASLPTLWIAEDDVGVHGCLAICRYLGRLWRLYPTDPVAALGVDSALEQLSGLLTSLPLTSPAVVLAQHLTELEARFERYEEKDQRTPWLEGMDQPSLADVCWAAALRWVLYATERDGLPDTHPRVRRWWEAVGV